MEEGHGVRSESRGCAQNFHTFFGHNLPTLLCVYRLRSSPNLTIQEFWQSLTLEKTLMLGKIEGRRRRGQQRMRCCSPRGCKESDTTEQLSLLAD